MAGHRVHGKVSSTAQQNKMQETGKQRPCSGQIAQVQSVLGPEQVELLLAPCTTVVVELKIYEGYHTPPELLCGVSIQYSEGEPGVRCACLHCTFSVLKSPCSSLPTRVASACCL